MLRAVTHRRSILLFLAVPAAILTRCVGDDSGVPDGGKDVEVDTTTADSGGDAPSDASSGDGFDGFSCNLGDAAPGSLDFTFSAGPKALGTFAPNAAAVDAQGRVYVAGTSADCGFSAAAVVHRFNSDGTHDTTFGGADAAATGVCIHYDSVDTAYAVAIDASGNVVVGGLSYNGSNRIHATVTRLTSTGAFDTTFNTTGKVDLNPTTGADNGFAAVQGIAFFGNKIVVTGSTEAIRPGVGTRHTGLIARLNPDGSSDTSFAGGLYTDTNVEGYYGVVADASGKVTAVGATNATPRQLVVRRLDVSGSPDGTFGDAGALTTLLPGDAGGATEGRAILVDGTRYLVGLPAPANNSGNYATGPSGVLGVTSSGAIDTTFGTGGLTTVPPMQFNIGYQLTAFAPECDGKILFGSRYDDPDAASNANQDIGISRLLPSGAIDTSFGVNGVAHFTQAGNEVTVAVAQDPSTGRIVVVGGNGSGQPVLARFNP